MSVEEEPLRVLIVGPSLSHLGGQSIQANLLLTRLSEEPDLITSFQSIDPSLPWPLHVLQRVKFVRTLVTFPVYCLLLARSIIRADVIHVFSASYFSFVLAPTPAIALSRLLHRRVIVNYHSGEAADHLDRWPSAVRWLRRADHVVVPSVYLQRIMSQYGIAATVVPNAVDLARFAFRRRDQLRPRFLCNRSLEGPYNVEGVVEAFARIQADIPEASLTIAGDGSLRQALMQKATSLGLTRVEFVGRVESEDMPTLYDNHDIWLNASRVDNMPLSILEAFSSGVAVVTTDAGGIPDLVDDGRTGLLAACEDTDALARCCLRLLREPLLAVRLTTAARDECDRFDWRAVREGWRREYFGLVRRE